jgi:uncharacterized membrane protein YgcG
MRRLLALMIGVLAAAWLSSVPAKAGTLEDCLARHHVCVSSDGRSLISQSQQDQLARQIGRDDIYLVIAASGSSGYGSAMREIISMLSARKQFTVGFLDSRLKHFGAYNRDMLPPGGAADIATTVVEQHRADGDIFAALRDFVREVEQQSGSAPVSRSPGPAASAPSNALRNVLIVVAIIFVIGTGLFLISRPRRMRRRQELKETKAAAQEDLIALSTRITDRESDVSVQANPDAAAEQAAALAAYERGTRALDAARRPEDMRAVSRAIAEGQYRLACAEALAKGEPRPGRRPSCFFDPRHGMSITDVSWVPPDGGPSRWVPACVDCARKIDEGIQPEMRTVESSGSRVAYVNSAFAPAYWGGYGFGPGMFTGFLLGELLAPPVIVASEYGFGGPGYPDGDFGGEDGGDFGGGDFGGDFGGGDFGGDGDNFGGGFSLGISALEAPLGPPRSAAATPPAPSISSRTSPAPGRTVTRTSAPAASRASSHTQRAPYLTACSAASARGPLEMSGHRWEVTTPCPWARQMQSLAGGNLFTPRRAGHHDRSGGCRRRYTGCGARGGLLDAPTSHLQRAPQEQWSGSR